MTTLEKVQIKTDNQASIKQLGYRINDWLPILDATALKDINEIKGRMAVMNAMVNIAFGAPN